MSPPSFSPTPEQEEIISASKLRDGNLMIEAGAGCAKTTTLVQAAKGMKGPSLAVAFNKAIAEEMKAKLPSNFESKTMNALGHQAWARSLGGMRLELDTGKLRKLINGELEDLSRKEQTRLWSPVKNLVERAQVEGLVPEALDTQGLGLVPDDQSSWEDMAGDLGIDLDDLEETILISKRVLETKIHLAKEGKIDFSDQVYCPTLLTSPESRTFPPFPLVMVDEDQDLSPLNHRMVERLLAPNGRLVCCGDAKQAIYGFRGASGDSAERLRKLREEDSWKDFPLMTSFRVPHLVAERQQDHVPGYRAWGTNPQGLVERWGGSQGEEISPLWGWKELGALASPGKSLAVLCRNNGPLLSLAFKLIRSGVGVVMLGRALGKTLIDLSRKICPEDLTPVDIFLGKVKEWEAKEIEKAEKMDKPERIAHYRDQAECLQAVAESGVGNAGEARRALERLFDREDGLVTLATGHKAKGLEWDTVVHLDPWRVPSKFARKAAARGDRRALIQELNLRYVIETRTKHTLVMANLEDWAGA